MNELFCFDVKKQLFPKHNHDDKRKHKKKHKRRLIASEGGMLANIESISRSSRAAESSFSPSESVLAAAGPRSNRELKEFRSSQHGGNHMKRDVQVSVFEMLDEESVTKQNILQHDDDAVLSVLAAAPVASAKKKRRSKRDRDPSLSPQQMKVVASTGAWYDCGNTTSEVVVGQAKSFRQALALFYQQYNPSKVTEVSTILSKFYGKYPLLIRNLERKYQAYGYFAKWNEAPVHSAFERLDGTTNQSMRSTTTTTAASAAAAVSMESVSIFESLDRNSESRNGNMVAARQQKSKDKKRNHRTEPSTASVLATVFSEDVKAPTSRHRKPVLKQIQNASSPLTGKPVGKRKKTTSGMGQLPGYLSDAAEPEKTLKHFVSDNDLESTSPESGTVLDLSFVSTEELDPFTESLMVDTPAVIVEQKDASETSESASMSVLANLASVDSTEPRFYSQKAVNSKLVTKVSVPSPQKPNGQRKKRSSESKSKSTQATSASQSMEVEHSEEKSTNLEPDNNIETSTQSALESNQVLETNFVSTDELNQFRESVMATFGMSAKKHPSQTSLEIAPVASKDESTNDISIGINAQHGETQVTKTKDRDPSDLKKRNAQHGETQVTKTKDRDPSDLEKRNAQHGETQVTKTKDKDPSDLKKRNDGASGDPPRRSRRRPIPTDRFTPNNSYLTSSKASKSGEANCLIVPVQLNMLQEEATTSSTEAPKQSQKKRSVSARMEKPKALKPVASRPKKPDGDMMLPTMPTQRKSSRTKKATDRYSPEVPIAETDTAMLFEERDHVPNQEESESESTEEEVVTRTEVLGIEGMRKEPLESESPVPIEEHTHGEGLKRHARKHRILREIAVQHSSDQLLADGWTSSQMRSLRSAYATADPRCSDFWGEVATEVEGHDEVECRQRWFEMAKTPAAKPKAKRKVKVQMDKKPGTERKSMGEDDFFNATPIRYQRPSIETEERKPQICNIDFGSPIIDTRSIPAVASNEFEEDDFMLQNVAPRGNQVSKTYIQNLRRDASKAEKAKKKGKKNQFKNGGSRTLLGTVDHGDVEVNGSLTPGGTVRLKTVDWNQEEDDFFGSDDDEY